MIANHQEANAQKGTLQETLCSDEIQIYLLNLPIKILKENNA